MLPRTSLTINGQKELREAVETYGKLQAEIMHWETQITAAKYNSAILLDAILKYAESGAAKCEEGV